MRFTPSGQAVTNFTVATNRKWTDAQGQPQEKTTWFKVTAWGKLAELCNQYLTKGKPVLIEGEIDASAWVGQDGTPRATLELTARTMRMLGSPVEHNGETPAPAPKAPSNEELQF